VTTKTKTYKFGPYSFKTYFKPAGNGYEVGFFYKGTPYFVSNFVQKSEAQTWWTKFNKEIQSFSKRYYASNKMPFTWYCNFMAKHLYTCYYNWLDKVFARHETSFKRAFTQDIRKYTTYKKGFSHKTAHPLPFKVA
jgi:hypothetical protein